MFSVLPFTAVCYYLCKFFILYFFFYPLTWVYFNSDEMGNKGAFITMGTDTKPNYTTYDAVVSLRSSPIFAQTAGLEGRGKCGYALVIWVTCPKGT